ncbi:MAG TPA: 16S rRNA (adenine(1518)-N(6)/adenine(1519)-N(6))-dimethyltransferase RsmA [Bacteroidota bacterium]|nr:16S rRNA (adenine(1518)-N(6)/adenine(1519)-N(6))-dimethyltransferase RsmA [Bacteroidota bacterium]
MIVPKKSLGQNFLRDENVARNILEEFSLHRNDFLLEIGAGTGALTNHLIGKVDRLLVVEIDSRAVEVLRERFGSDLEIIQKDILEVDPAILKEKYGKRIRVVGNIPYYITSEILFWMIDNRTAFEDAVVMMQLDVARRLVAKRRTKEYGILSVVTQCYSDAKILFRVSRNSFYPAPNVDSAVVRLRMRQSVPDHNEKLFREVVRGTFGKRRKTLFNGLRFMGFTEEGLASTGLDLKRRPEELSVEDFIELTRKLDAKSEVINPKS